MDNIAKFKLSRLRDIENLNDKGTVILSYSLADDRVCIKKTVNKNTGEIYKKIKNSENMLLPEIYDIIDCGDSCVVIEEYIKGRSVEKIISENRAIDEKTACGYIADILTALESVHSLDIIHRDISPDNVIIDEAGRARLLDFDIARTTGKRQSTDTVILGTAGFASPEQYGFAQTDCRSDIYSVGVLFNYMLTGTILQNKLYNKEPVCSVIKKAASFERDLRYSSCGEMLKEDCFDFYTVTPGTGKKNLQKNIDKKAKSLLSCIPGFRTRKIYKMASALALYLLIIAITIYQYRETGSFSEAVILFIDSLIVFVYPMWWFGNRGKEWEKLPFMRGLKPIPKIAAAIGIYLAAMALLCNILPS